ncbi:MAG: NrsF family protein [Congregibacter sp.]
MSRFPNPLIEQMVAELQPVRSIKFRDGIALLSLTMLLTVLGVELLDGLWRGALAGQASAFFVMTNGLLLVLGCASTHSVLKMATPHVGNQHDGPKWAMAMVAVLPITAVLVLLGDGHALGSLFDSHGVVCFGAALMASALSAGSLVFWSRRGAAVLPHTAGLHIGVASTALGSAAYGLACSLDGVVHLGVWHVAPVLVGALLGRFMLPSLLRW